MIVEQPEAFKTWLTAVLKPLCDADPAALAKYVLALVKRDKTEEELQKIMVGQLQVFLENETESFVALVLRTLETQDYIPAPVIPNANPPNPIVKATSSSTATTAAASSPITTAKETTTSTSTSTTKPIIVPPSELPNLNEATSATAVNGSSSTSSAVAGSTAATGGGAKKEHESATVATPAAAAASAATTAAAGAKRDRESRKSEAEKEDKPPSRSVRARLQHRSTSRNRSRSRSWDRSKQRSKSRERDLDSKPSHRLDSGSSRSDNKRERPRAWRNKSPPMRRFLDRRRSRTPPSPMLSGRERDRGLRSRSRSPLPPKHSRSSRYNRNRTPPRSLSRSRSRSRSLEKRERRDSIKDKESTNKDGGHSSSRPVTPTPDSNHGGRDRDRDNDPDFRLGGGANSLGQTLQSVVVAQQQPTSTTGNKRRCRDFDEKGYCMRGEMCPFDHGCDPVVLEDSALTSVLTYNPNGAGGAAAVIAGEVVGGGPPPPLGVGIGPMLNAAAGPGHPLMVPGHHPRGIIPPEYNPQAPQMWNRGGGGPPGFRGPRPMGMPRGPMMGGFPPPPHMQRELIPVPVMDNKPHHHHQQQHMHNPQQHHHHHPHHHPYASGPPGGVGGGGNPMMGGFRPQMAYNTGPARSSLGGLGAKNPANCSLELKKIPPGLNSITHLNNHFSKFGKPVNIQVNYEGDPEAAIVTFSSHAEANAAYRSTEAVLNNRFIKVFWHNANADGKQENVPPPQRSIKDRLGKPTIVPPNTNKVLNLVQPRAVIAAAAAAAAENNQVATETNNNSTDSSGNEKSLNPPGVTTPTAPHLNNNNNNNDNNNGNNSASPTATTHREETKAQQAAAIKKGQELLAAKEKLKKNQDEQRKEVLRIKNNLRKRKQELLEKQLSQQKILIEKMEKLPPGPQRDLVLETIKKTQESIEEIKKDLLQSVLLSKAAAANTPLTAQQQQQAALAQKRLNSISKDDVQREMLDAELDLITKQQEGADTTEIQKRLAELRAKAAMAMAARNSGGGGGGRGRGRVGGRFNPVVSRHLLTKNNLIDNNSGLKGNIKSVNRTFQKHTVDHRPTRLLVSGYEGDEQESVLSHFQTFGVIVDYVTDSTLPSITLNYKTRKEAEMALLKGKNFQDRTLSITWCTGVPLNNPMTSRPNPRKVVISESEEDQLIEQSVPEGDEDLGPEISEEVLLQDDEEEEDESEDRSWRR